ncbi:short-chain dehydrogenase [Burkholderia cenocepacia]|uniref:Rossmann fold domain-containing protein n=1 Tax=Burkholderia cenocepacia TaxID=95486 RepID=UPI0009813331|nr:short-chain dehydrogenase [Burkholderia cenocepacia]ONZ31595.1 short-chain dehydrogenase [Burkholderia cenocepacia]ONZ56185.1 short-chain dehydrogenase [Burkholderia cenocepacia]ONZ64734.1 short-chain dehydrogenase [Burkholderia cenocepacia]ONZ77849.1 short-chain dehydrogenase [Burkholderia cenocepacia]ONZ93248.1 short-chain dehydrogenase [Burkholderia cenocepacia]
MTVSADTSTPRVVLVTGALSSAADAASIGRALATGFARRGWDVALQRSHGAPRAAADALVAALARNVTAPLALARALADATPDAAREHEALRACAIHVLDQALFHPAPAQLSHALMQAALNRATSALALALAPKVRVAALVRGHAPHADDIAAAACYLASAPGVTGATLTVDGGEHLVPPAAGPNE